MVFSSQFWTSCPHFMVVFLLGMPQRNPGHQMAIMGTWHLCFLESHSWGSTQESLSNPRHFPKAPPKNHSHCRFCPLLFLGLNLEPHILPITELCFQSSVHPFNTTQQGLNWGTETLAGCRPDLNHSDDWPWGDTALPGGARPSSF